MELYKIKASREKPVRLRLIEDNGGPPASPEGRKGDTFMFNGYIDGMYAPVQLNGERAYIVAWAEVEIVPDP